MSQYAALFTGESAESNDSGNSMPKENVYKILLVDDEKNVLSALKRVFRQENYQVITANNGEEALQLLEQQKIQLMISDYMMPKMNGAELLKITREKHPDMIRIMLTGHADTSAVMAAIKEGAVYKFILKPWNDDDLRITVGLALEQYDLKQKNNALKKSNTKKSKELNALSKLAVTNRSQLAIMLHKRNLINDKQAQELYKLQQSRKTPMIKLILDKEWVAKKKIREIMRKKFLIDEVSLDEFQIDPAILSLVPRSFCQRQLVLPLKQEGRRVMLAMADPMDMGLIDDLRFSSGLEFQAVMADVAAIEDKISEAYGGDEVSFEDLETLISDVDPYEGIEIIIEDDDVSLEELLQGSDEPPSIRLVNVILLEAIRQGASDIHIQPRTKNVVVRYRIDGMLVDKIQIPQHLHMSLVSRIKVMAELDITERRKPQDGRIAVKTPLRVVDVRLSSLPTINGEKIVMRILDRNASIHSVSELGFAAKDLSKILNVVNKPQGIVLTTGPTGSGKTTSLYSLLHHNADSTKNYVTIEDPVEYYMDMAGQVAIRENIGLDFPTVLRAILRQDPDVILLGEIRDFETAEVAFHAALTGHLVFSTLHTNSTVATVARLFDLGLKPYVVASALEAIIAQRLVRKICEDCKHPIEPDAQKLHKLGPVFEKNNIKTFAGAGCRKCNNSGYSGRLGIYEVLVPDERMKHLITSGASLLELGRAADEMGMTTLLKDGARKVHEGLTTLDEVLRILGPQVID